MTIELQTDETKNIAYIRLTGSLNRETILDAFDAAVSDKRYRKEMAKYSMKFPPGINDVKVAFVTSKPLEFGLSRMFEAYSSDAGTAISVFYTMDDAEAWLSSVTETVP